MKKKGENMYHFISNGEKDTVNLALKIAPHLKNRRRNYTIRRTRMW